MTVRIGQGVDVHAFSSDPGRALVLGGLTLPGEPGLVGHSDADVVVHALVDAVLGAAGLGDLGALFGTADPVFAGASSRTFMHEALRRLAVAGWSVGNVDATVIAQRPRLAPVRRAMVTSVAGMMGVQEGRVSIKATTTDGLGLTGRGEGIACMAVALVTSP